MSIILLGDLFLKEEVEIPEFKNKYVVVNLEGPVTKSRNPYPGKVNLKINPSIFNSVVGSKISAVCLANNHIMDYGEEGFRETINYLDERGVDYFGAGKKQLNYGNPSFAYVDETKVAFMGYVCRSTSPVLRCGNSFGCAPLTTKRVISDIEKSKKEGADRTIVQFHWGAEEVFLPKPGDVEIARTVVDAGADLVLGHHAHVAQVFEIYENTHIFYGLGNYIMPDLNERSFYSEGKYTRRYNRKQYSWNRYSLCIEYYPIDSDVKVKRSSFKSNTLSISDNYNSKSRKYLLSSIFYEKIYKIVYILSKIRRIIMNFIEDPKVPEKEHIKNIINIVLGNKKS